MPILVAYILHDLGGTRRGGSMMFDTFFVLDAYQGTQFVAIVRFGLIVLGDQKVQDFTEWHGHGVQENHKEIDQGRHAIAQVQLIGTGKDTGWYNFPKHQDQNGRREYGHPSRH
eukprot:scaffold37599_cov290-Amphora_coffeaeformis.AAC.3